MVQTKIDNHHIVAFFSDALYTGGAEKYLYLLASNIDRELFQPVLVINKHIGLEHLKTLMEREGIDVYEVSLKLPSSLRGVVHMIGLLRELKPSIFHINLPGPFDSQYSLVAPIARLAGVKHLVSTEHLAMVPSFPKGKMFKSFGTCWIDRVITVSEDNRTHLMQEHGIPQRKIKVIYNGLPDPSPVEPVDIRRELHLGNDTFLLVIVGALEDRKGHRTIFHVMNKLLDRTHLLVIGVGEMEEEYRRIVSELNIDDRVHFLGYRRDVVGILKRVDLLVLTSRMEATPYVILEAMAVGLPVVVSNIYGIPELVVDGRTGCLVEEDDIDGVANAVITMLRNRDLRVSMGAEARKCYEARFRIETSVSKTVDIYRELVGTGPGNLEDL